MSLRRTLQRETDGHHRTLDALVQRQGCFDHLSGYGRWLHGMYAFHAQIAVAFGAPDRFSINSSRYDERVRLIASDLGDLGLAPEAWAPNEAFTIADRSEALGVLYVSEGASLGARVLVRRAAGLGCTHARAGRYLAAEAGSLANWQAALAALAAANLDEAATERAVTAGKRTFALAATCLGGVSDV
jgi:heme oxygenase